MTVLIVSTSLVSAMVDVDNLVLRNLVMILYLKDLTQLLTTHQLMSLKH